MSVAASRTIGLRYTVGFEYDGTLDGDPDARPDGHAAVAAVMVVSAPNLKLWVYRLGRFEAFDREDDIADRDWESG